MLQVKNISRSFDELEVLDGVSFDVETGSMLGVIGPSGCGKSVLLKAIGQVDEQYGGDVVYPSGVDMDEISLMFQEGALFDSLSVLDNVAFPLVAGKVPVYLLEPELRDEVIGKVEEILSRVGLSDAIFKMPAQLSGGMRRRVSLARALVARPELLLLDDPTCGLDPVASSVIMDLIVEMHADYSPTTIIVSQDLRRLLPIVEKIAAIWDGKTCFHGSLGELEQTAPEYLMEFVSCRFDFTVH